MNVLTFLALISVIPVALGIVRPEYLTGAQVAAALYITGSVIVREIRALGKRD